MEAAEGGGTIGEAPEDAELALGSALGNVSREAAATIGCPVGVAVGSRVGDGVAVDGRVVGSGLSVGPGEGSVPASPVSGVSGG
jgi:hypothetical protein